jgi:hypothetical protein
MLLVTVYVSMYEPGNFKQSTQIWHSQAEQLA